jgi:hypothetical protein
MDAYDFVMILRTNITSSVLLTDDPLGGGGGGGQK